MTRPSVADGSERSAVEARKGVTPGNVQAAIVLAGGRSTRMGRDKPSIVIGGKSMLARVLDAVCAVTPVVVVAKAAGQELPPFAHDVIVVEDEISHAGPLVALSHALAALPAHIERCFVCAADLPQLAPAVVARLLALSVGFDVTVFDRDGLQLLAAVYRTALAPRITALVSAGELSMRALVAASTTRVVSAAEMLADDDVAATDPGLASFDDVDLPSDLEALR